MSQTDVTNPGLVNVADEGDGLLSVDQCVQVTTVAGGVTSNPAQVTGGGAYTNTNPDCVDVSDEGYGQGLPRNVNVG